MHYCFWLQVSLCKILYYLTFRLQCRIAGRTSSLAWRSRLRTATTLSTRPLPMAARGGLMGAGCFPTPIGWRQSSGSRDTLPSSDTRVSDKTPARTSGWISARTKSTQWDGAPQKENHSYHQRVRLQVWNRGNDPNLKPTYINVRSFLASLFLQPSKQSKTTGRISLSRDWLELAPFHPTSILKYGSPSIPFFGLAWNLRLSTKCGFARLVIEFSNSTVFLTLFNETL